MSYILIGLLFSSVNGASLSFTPTPNKTSCYDIGAATTLQVETMVKTVPYGAKLDYTYSCVALTNSFPATGGE